MTPEENKEIIRKAYNDSAILMKTFAEDATYTFFGRHFFARTFRGRESIVRDLFGPMREMLSERIKLDITNIVGDGDFVVLEAKGQAKALDGTEYDNNYCIVLHMRDGMIVSVREYLDTELISDLFGHRVD